MKDKQNLINELIILINDCKDNDLLEIIKNLLILQAH